MNSHIFTSSMFTLWVTVGVAFFAIKAIAFYCVIKPQITSGKTADNVWNKISFWQKLFIASMWPELRNGDIPMAPFGEYTYHKSRLAHVNDTEYLIPNQVLSTEKLRTINEATFIWCIFLGAVHIIVIHPITMIGAWITLCTKEFSLRHL